MGPEGGEAHLRIYSVACPTVGGSAAAALFERDFAALLAGKAREKLIRSLVATNEIISCCLELLRVVAAVVALGDQGGGKRIIAFSGNRAAAGSLMTGVLEAPVLVA